MELDKLFDDIWKTLYKSFVFYIPSRLMHGLEYNNLLNKVILIDRKGFDRELKDEESHYEILIKPMTLNDNIFKLIDQNERLPTEQFQFFLEKYLEHVNFVFYVSDWMEKHVEVDIPGLREDTKNAFKSQTKVFSQHVEDLKTHIIIANESLKKDVNVQEFIENDLTEIKRALHISTDSGKLNDLVNKAEDSTLIKKKAPLLTDEEAEAFLLETVFQIKKDF
jgi:hypothetical protein